MRKVDRGTDIVLCLICSAASELDLPAQPQQLRGEVVFAGMRDECEGFIQGIDSTADVTRLQVAFTKQSQITGFIDFLLTEVGAGLLHFRNAARVVSARHDPTLEEGGDVRPHAKTVGLGKHLQLVKLVLKRSEFAAKRIEDAAIAEAGRQLVGGMAARVGFGRGIEFERAFLVTRHLQCP